MGRVTRLAEKGISSMIGIYGIFSPGIIDLVSDIFFCKMTVLCFYVINELLYSYGRQENTRPGHT